MAQRSPSTRSQDISHLLSSTFKDLYTGDVIGADIEANWLKSRGGDDAYHEAFTEELQKLVAEYNRRLTEADIVEENIIQAQARAKAEEERALNVLKGDAGKDFHKMGLPPVASSFRWIVDNELLRKNHLTCPDDYITDKLPVTRAPKGKPEPGYVKETFSFKQRISSRSCDQMSAHLQKISGRLPSVSLSTLTLPSTPDSYHQTKKTSKKSSASQKADWKGSKCKAEREEERAYFAKLEKRQNFLKNPRFFPPNALHGGKSLVMSQGQVEQVMSSREAECNTGDTSFVPVFLANPPTLLFSDYEVGQLYEITVELQNITSTCHRVRVIPPSTSVFAIGPGKFPGKGGMIAPGMTCQYTVQFVPESLADYEDHILVETQVSEPLLIPIQAKRPPPVLTLPDIIDCGFCLVGGIKVTVFLCRNEGFSSGKFCIMPHKAWPPPNFRAVATLGFVIQDPFGIYPAVFELSPGQSTKVKVLFFPSLPEVSEQIYTIVCDNCQVNYITVTGVGQLIALKLLHVTGGESSPEPGEVTDVTAQHLVRFDPQNPHTTTQKNLVIRNSTHVELPFYWQIIKPNLQPILPEETAHSVTLEYNRETELAFSLSPEQGVLLPYSDHDFTLTYTPQEMKIYHSVIQLVLRDIPESPSLARERMLQNMPEYTAEDVIALDIEVKGSTEPFQLLLEPYAVIIPGESFLGVNVRRTFKMWNNSKSLIKYTWENITDCAIMEVEPPTGVIDRNKYCEFELMITGIRPGCVSHNLQCQIEHSAEPVVLHVEAAFKGPLLHIGVPSLRLGLIKPGESVVGTFEIQNLCQLPARWRIQESQVCLAERNEEVSPFTIQPSAEELPPLGTCSVSVQYVSLLCQRLHTVLELEVENGERSYLPVSVEVQTPQACLLSSHLVLTEMYTGIPVKATSKLFNQTRLPAKYSWGKLIGSQAAFCSATITPASGILSPNEEKEFCIELTANITGELKGLALFCSIEDMTEPLLLSISGEVKGLHVTYSVPCEGGDASDERKMLQSPRDLLLDFGSEVALKDTVKRQLILTNHTAISAPFRLEAVYFTGSSPTPEQSICLSSGYLMKRRGPITKHAARRAQSEFAAVMLSHGKGVAFHIQPSSGTLQAFQQLIIEITAYNNMWGEYSDDLVCKVGDLPPTLIPMQITVKGCPIFLQMTGPQTQRPTIRFGTHVSGGRPVFRSVRLNNPTPFDIRLDWETYNQEEDDKKLVDLLMFFGDPFPPKDMAKNETASTGSNSEIVLGLDQPPIPCGSIHPALQTTDESSNTECEEEGIITEEPTRQKIVSVLLRPHEGVPADNPYSITPRQIVIPGGGSSSVCISFTPHVLPEPVTEVRCEGFLLGFMSLDDELAKTVPGKVHRRHGYDAVPLRIDLRASVRQAVLKVDMDHDGGMVFYSMASDLIPDQPLLGVLTASVLTQSLKLTNCTKVPLYFRLFLSAPFSLTSTDLKKGTKTSHNEKEETEQQPQLVLYPQQNMLVKVSFPTTLESLMYQHLPDTQILPGFQVLQFESGERKLKFSQNLIIEYSNHSRQLVPVTAYLTVPVLELSCNMVDFKTCFVAQTKTEHVFLCNRSGCRSYWTALLDQQEGHNDLEVFSVSPANGILEAREGEQPTKDMLQITFTARSDTEYETILTVTGILGEKPCKLQIRGQGTYDGKYEDMY
ncbi:deleted in lung and esophageal cancer protein 1 isoform X2 [Phasianus colchicus]|uniref:deleted in lung and esophageal cancer protein 1 isoform X2 n=1 Tax=Phasianus colchicus TaxID=9054 RepID=UPI00129D9970|nr:deleted in lung and esophageal cancer protein 1 isoform X2 [Phasianus colchicus]